jgi:hypothetical protein
MNKEMLFRVLAAANFMEIPPLLDLACLWCTFQISGKSPEEVIEFGFAFVSDLVLVRFRSILLLVLLIYSLAHADTTLAESSQYDSRRRSTGT